MKKKVVKKAGAGTTKATFKKGSTSAKAAPAPATPRKGAKAVSAPKKTAQKPAKAAAATPKKAGGYDPAPVMKAFEAEVKNEYPDVTFRHSKRTFSIRHKDFRGNVLGIQTAKRVVRMASGLLIPGKDDGVKVAAKGYNTVILTRPSVDEMMEVTKKVMERANLTT